MLWTVPRYQKASLQQTSQFSLRQLTQSEICIKREFMLISRLATAMH